MELIEQKAQKRAPSTKLQKPRALPNVVDMVAVLQESLQRAGNRKKPSAPRSTSARSTSALVKQKRRSVAA